MRSRLFAFSYGLAFIGFLVLCLRLGYPLHRLWAVMIYVASLGLFVYGLRKKTSVVQEAKTFLNTWLAGRFSKIFYCLLFFFFGYLLWVLVPLEKSELSEFSEEELAQHIRDDLETVLFLNDNLKAAYQELSASGLLKNDIASLQLDELETVKDHWAAFVASTFEFDILKEKYKGFYQINYRSQPSLHAESFALAYGAYVAQYRGILFLNRLVDHNAYFESIFNESDPARGIPENTYFALSQHTTHPHTLLRFSAGRRYYQSVEKHIVGHEAAKQELVEAISDVQEALLSEPERFIDNPLDFFEKSVFKAWVPFQKTVALGLSNIRLTDRENLIDRETIQAYRDKFEPGDVFLERRHWYATNIGIPGFWPHAAFYIGDLASIDAYFADLDLEGGRRPSELIAEQYPVVFERMQEADTDGDRYCILEAIKPGVVLNTLEKSANADALSVLRPNVSKKEKFEAILRAMAYHGKPYDYNFEFATDNALVCSELVYKAYQGADGFELQTIVMNGRNLLPPNLIAQKFDQEYDQREPQMSLVLFLDSDTTGLGVVEKGVDAFRESWRRPKWYLLAEALER